MTVIRHDGRPAAGVRVVLHGARADKSKQFRTGENGEVTVAGLMFGPVQTAVREPGFLFGEGARLFLGTGEHAATTLREDPGRAIEVRCGSREARGEAAPGSSLLVLRLPEP